MIDHLLELKQAIEDQKALIEELEECGELEERLEAALELDRLEGEFFRQKMIETGGL